MSIKRLGIMVIIAFTLCLLWAGLELGFYGEVQPRIVDNIIGAILTTSIYYNVEPYIKE